MWTLNQSEEFSDKGTVTKNGSFNIHTIMPKTRVVVVDIKSFPDIIGHLRSISSSAWTMHLENTPATGLMQLH